MYSNNLPLLLSLFFVLVYPSHAQHNITVNDTSPLIQYEGNAADATICKVNADGTIPSAQPGCYNVLNCTGGVAMGQGGSGAASFSFKGSAIYIESALNFVSPIYTVTLDGVATDVDGVRDSRPFVCAPLFSRTGLDPNVEHTVRLSIKGPSPNRDTTIPNSETRLVFSLASYTFTEGAETQADNDISSTPTSSESGSSSPTSGSAGPATTSSGAEPLLQFGGAYFIPFLPVLWFFSS